MGPNSDRSKNDARVTVEWRTKVVGEEDGGDDIKNRERNHPAVVVVNLFP